MKIHSLRKAITKDYVRLSLFKHIEGVPSKIKLQEASSRRSSVVISSGGEERYYGQGKNDEVLLHTVNLLPKKERLKRTNILVSLSSLLQRIFKLGSLTMGAIGFDGA